MLHCLYRNGKEVVENQHALYLNAIPPFLFFCRKQEIYGVFSCVCFKLELVSAILVYQLDISVRGYLYASNIAVLWSFW